jgi:hypothetical protein
MVRCLRKHYSGGKIRLLIDGPCKSAGALFALGVDEIAFGPRGELGPLDTQLTKQDEIMFMSSGLDILQALSVATSNAFDSCFTNMLELIKRSGGSISTKTAAEIASSVTAGVFQPITAQIDPLRMGEAQRSMRIAREYGERLASKLLKPNALDKLVQDYPSHGFVIDKEEALKYFTQIDDFTADEVAIAEWMSESVRWPKDEPEVFDITNYFYYLKKLEDRRAAAKAKAEADAAKAEVEKAAAAAAKDASNSPQGAGTNGTTTDGGGSSAPATESTGQSSNVPPAPPN